MNSYTVFGAIRMFLLNKKVSSTQLIVGALLFFFLVVCLVIQMKSSWFTSDYCT